MPQHEEIKQFMFLDHTQPPRQLGSEEVKKFFDLCKKLDYLRIAGVVPIESPKKSVAGLIRMIEMNENHLSGSYVAGPYIREQNGSFVYYPEGTTIYKRPASGPTS